jgi:hypothetical protein
MLVGLHRQFCLSRAEGLRDFVRGVRDIQEHTFVLELAIEEVKFKSGTLPSAGRSSPTNLAPTHTDSSLSFF